MAPTARSRRSPSTSGMPSAYLNGTNICPELHGDKRMPGNYSCRHGDQLLGQRVPYEGTEWQENSGRQGPGVPGKAARRGQSVPRPRTGRSSTNSATSSPSPSTPSGRRPPVASAACRWTSPYVPCSPRTTTRSQAAAALLSRRPDPLRRERLVPPADRAPGRRRRRERADSLSVASKVEGLEGQPIQLHATMTTAAAETDITWTVVGTGLHRPGRHLLL